jgi:hypothetical protein
MGFTNYLEGLGIMLHRHLHGFVSFSSLYVICKIPFTVLLLNIMMQGEQTLVMDVLSLEHLPNKFCIFNSSLKITMDFLMRLMKAIKETCKDMARANLLFLIYQKLSLFL